MKVLSSMNPSTSLLGDDPLLLLSVTRYQLKYFEEEALNQSSPLQVIYFSNPSFQGHIHSFSKPFLSFLITGLCHTS